jgi:hypothetical protein
MKTNPTKKTFTHGMHAWIKVLLTGICPASELFSCDDENGSALSLADNYSPL